MPQIYLDVCCLNRPFDDQRQDRIRLEADAVLLILGQPADLVGVLRFRGQLGLVDLLDVGRLGDLGIPALGLRGRAARNSGRSGARGVRTRTRPLRSPSTGHQLWRRRSCASCGQLLPCCRGMWASPPWTAADKWPRASAPQRRMFEPAPHANMAGPKPDLHRSHGTEISHGTAPNVQT